MALGAVGAALVLGATGPQAIAASWAVAQGLGALGAAAVASALWVRSRRRAH